jgi:hypothetical protein
MFVELTNSVVPEPEGLPPCSQEPDTSPYPKPGECLWNSYS